MNLYSLSFFYLYYFKFYFNLVKHKHYFLDKSMVLQWSVTHFFNFKCFFIHSMFAGVWETEQFYFCTKGFCFVYKYVNIFVYFCNVTVVVFRVVPMHLVCLTPVGDAPHELVSASAPPSCTLRYTAYCTAVTLDLDTI